MPDKCPECQSYRLNRDYARGELICSKCGLIIEDNIVDAKSEPVFDFEMQQNRSHTGAPNKLSKLNKGLNTEIDRYNRDIHGKRISPKNYVKFDRIRKWHRRSSIVCTSSINLAIALSELSRISSYLGLSEHVKESSALLYRKCLAAKLISGKKIETIVSAVIYLTCRMQRVPRSLFEIAQVSGIKENKIGRAYRFIRHRLDINVPIFEPAEYIPKYIAALKLSGYVQEKAILLLKRASEMKLTNGKGPIGVAAVFIYIAAAIRKEWRSQTEVSNATGISNVTIRNMSCEIKEKMRLNVAF